MTDPLSFKPELTLEINNTNHQKNPHLCLKNYKIGIFAKFSMQ